MSETKNVVAVRIAGEEHVIRSTADPEHTRRCARLLDERIAEIRALAGPMEPQRIAILAGLSLADELLSLEAEHARTRTEIAARADALVGRVEQLLAGDQPNPRREGGSTP